MTAGLARLQRIYDLRREGDSIKSFHLSDPVGFPKRFSGKKEIETAALISALFAIGPRYAILRSLERIFSELGESPYDSISDLDCSLMLKKMDGHVQFAYKNITGKDVVQILCAVKSVLRLRGTVQEALKSFAGKDEKTSYGVLTGFLGQMKSAEIPPALGGSLTPRARALLASPRDGSACKRMNMFLRWMTRKDEIDFGFYDWLGTENLIIPLDVNVSRAARKLELTKRKTDNWKTATEITEKLKELDPADPVKYDVPLFLYGMELRKTKRAA